MIERKNPDVGYLNEDVYQAFVFSQTVKAGDLYFFSGLAPLTGDVASLRLVGEGDMAAQLNYCLDMLDALLKKEGLDRSNVVSWTTYTTDMAALNAVMAPILRDWCGSQAPANTMVEVSGFVLPGQWIEITPIAVAD